MKKFYLIYNTATNQYIFGEGPSYNTLKSRKEYSPEEVEQKGIVKILKELVDVKRNSLLSLIDIPEEFVEKIREEFKDTKVQLSLKKE